MIALMDFIVENAKTGNATPGSSQTVRKVTAGGCGWMWGWGWDWEWEDCCYWVGLFWGGEGLG